MDESPTHHVRVEGELVAELLDQSEYPSKVGNVAAVSDRQIVLLRRDRRELINYRLEAFDMADCRAIEYRRETAWYRIVVAAACFAGVGVLLVLLLLQRDELATRGTPLIIGIVACLSFGARFATSIHRHVIRFEMPGETLVWRSPAIDYGIRAAAAQAVRAFARERGILRE